MTNIQKEVIGDATLYCGDCLEVMPGLGKVDALISDPPYGMNANTDSTRFSGGSVAAQARRGKGKKSPRVINDDKDFDPTPFLGFKHVILFGHNHYAARLPVGQTLVWIKRKDPAFGSFLSDAELAWQAGGHGVYCFRDLSMYATAKHRVHPTQKPIPLMEWCVLRTKGSRVILDPFMGSGSTGVACMNLGREFIGIELDNKHFDAACERITRAQAQGRLL